MFEGPVGCHEPRGAFRRRKANCVFATCARCSCTTDQRTRPRHRAWRDGASRQARRDPCIPSNHIAT
jgi:hypothetical protein